MTIKFQTLFVSWVLLGALCCFIDLSKKKFAVDLYLQNRPNIFLYMPTSGMSTAHRPTTSGPSRPSVPKFKSDRPWA
jgi:hypothetical protein